MSNRITCAIAAIGLPLGVLVVGGIVMNYVSGRRFPPDPSRPGSTLQPLNQRWQGYNAEAIAQYWGGLDHSAKETTGKEAERRFLRFDLVFPLIFGGVLVVSIFWSANRTGPPFSPLGPILLVVVGTIADWTENLTQLRLLGDFINQSPIDPGLARVASIGTIMKLWTDALAIGCIAIYAFTGGRPGRTT
jgi:hypothetical protein